MATSVEEAIKKLERAVSLLESAIVLKQDVEKRRGDIELELQLMQDDRVRLAEELDGTTNRLARMENVVTEVSARVEQAIETVEDVLVTSGEADEFHDE